MNFELTDRDTPGPLVVCVGEALFDRLPDGEVLGGAPVNVAVHANRMLQPLGGRAEIITRVGQDDAGERLVRRLEAHGLGTQFVQRDSSAPTGAVDVGQDPHGDPIFCIPHRSAWDFIDAPKDATRLVADANAVCFGTLAQRNEESREGIRELLQAAPDAIRACDLNLREPFYSRDVILQSLEIANVVKLSEAELRIVGTFLGNDVESVSAIGLASSLVQRFGLRLLALTRGARGTLLIDDSRVVEGTVISPQREPDADSVGAGDACFSAIVCGLLFDMPLERIADHANRLGAFVVSQRGATPELPPNLLIDVRTRSATFGARSVIDASTPAPSHRAG